MAYDSNKTDFLLGLCRGTMITVNSHPYVRMADSIQHHLEGMFLDVLTGEWKHASVLGDTKYHIKTVYGSEVQW